VGTTDKTKRQSRLVTSHKTALDAARVPETDMPKEDFRLKYLCPFRSVSQLKAKLGILHNKWA